MSNIKNTSMADDFACFGRGNYILMAISALLIVVGFVLMSGSGTTMSHFESDIFSNLRIVCAPTLCFIGYVLMVLAIAMRFGAKP